MARIGTILFCLALPAGCANSTLDPQPEVSVQRATTLTRFDGEAISLEELESIRASAIAAAETVARIEHGLREPGAEQRTPQQFMEELSALYPADTRLARTLWESAEPKGPGHDRREFREFGYYSNQLAPSVFGPRVRPQSLEDFVELLNRQHDDRTEEARLLAAWRRFSPIVATRRPAYLSASWQLELDYVRAVEVKLAESLLGPHLRCTVGDTGGVSFQGPVDSHEGYTAPMLLLDLLLPGPSSPVGPAIEALSLMSDGSSEPLPFSLSDGRRDATDELDVEFLRAALHGLKEGFAELDALPAGVMRITVTFSYLVDLGEARSSLSFRRTAGGWVLEMFDYEPAAASLLGSDARLDLLPGIRDLALGGRRE